MKTFTIYNILTGEVKRIGSAPDNMVAIQALDGEGIILNEMLDHDTQYIINSIPTLRTEMLTTINKLIISADGIDVCVIQNIPLNTEIFINDVFKGIELDGITEISFDTLGIYNIKLVLFPYLNMEYIINAN